MKRLLRPFLFSVVLLLSFNSSFAGKSSTSNDPGTTAGGVAGTTGSSTGAGSWWDSVLYAFGLHV